jgi:endonuclease/exonuclease/phosphatase family metal-dependent hydrolase
MSTLQASALRRRGDSAALRVVTYNIHKGVRGLGPRKRLEIHNLEKGVAALQADVVMLQEVRLFHHRDARRFAHGPKSWPSEGQAEFLAPEGWHCAYRTNAITRHGEHGNALICRWPLGTVGHHDVSDHRFEQRGLLHVPFEFQGQRVHAVVVHFGLMRASRARQAQRLIELIAAEVPHGEAVLVGGDFNDWSEQLDAPLTASGLVRSAVRPSFPSRIPLWSLDRFYVRGLRCTGVDVPRGAAWARMSDHLPVVAEFEWDVGARRFSRT